MDTALNVINRFHTIDTFKRANVNVAQVKSKNYSTLASPPTKVNFRSCVSDGFLLIESPLLAQNQDKVEFQKSVTIDVYDLSKGKYLYSFYLQLVDGNPPSSFLLSESRLAVIYDTQLVVYSLDRPKGVD